MPALNPGRPLRPEAVELVASDPRWPAWFVAERERLMGPAGFAALEHVGSTAVPGLWAKPVIDMMAAVYRFDEVEASLRACEDLGYERVDAGMPQRFFLVRPAQGERPRFHLHVVEAVTWGERHERLMRDHLLAHPEARQAYELAKREAAQRHAGDSMAYTRAKTAVVQDVVDAARAARGWPSVPVWEE